MSRLTQKLATLLTLVLLGTTFGPRPAAAQAGTKTYEVTISNISNSQQAFSPPIIATHAASLHAWQMGQKASPGIEKIAEEGMSDMLAAELQGKATEVVASKAHLLPGDNITLMITARDGDVLSYASMLSQTNDGFTGVDSMPLTDGSKDLDAYDAGTEENTEKKTDVPGPPFGGKNSGPDPSPHQPIAVHGGITGKADVTPEFNWTGPVARIVVRAVPTPTTPTQPTYDVTITNITDSMQGLSPLIVATHPASAHAWQMGQAASPGLELLAEEGMPGALAAELQASATDIMTTGSHLLPMDSITVRVSANPGDVISVGTMLIETNDGFTGLDSASLADGSIDVNAYDAGTEENTEKKTDVPGPPFGGKNSGPATAPRGVVADHPNIAGIADVTPEFRWSGPVARITIKTVSAGASPTGAPVAAATATSTSGVMPSMPNTGGPESSLWIIAVTAAILSIMGLAIRRSTSTKQG